jgi:hypothetical protein
MSGGNIRRALSFLTAFIGSGHVDTTKILDAIGSSGSYLVPLHEFMRAVIYGDHKHYFPPASPVPNLLDISQPDSREHFLLPIILEFVERTGGDLASELYVSVRSIYEYAQQLGFLPAQVEFALTRAREKELLDFAHPLDGEAAPTRCRITTVGAYGRRRLLGTFAYIDAVIVDLPIVDPDVTAAVRDAQTLADRLQRAEIVLEYLDRCWDQIGGGELGFDWAEFSQAVSEDINRARISSARQAGRPMQ